MRNPLKILALSDMHWYTNDELNRIQSLDYDLCVLLGDIQVPVIRLMKEYAGDRPVLAVAGNHDEWDTPERGGAENIHGRCVTHCGLISQPFYFMMIFRRLPENAVEFLTNWNVLFTFCLSFLVLQISENPKFSIPLKVILSAVCLLFAEFGDWSYFPPVWTLLFHKCRDHSKARTILFICVSVFMVLERFAADADSLIDFSFQFGVLLAPALIGLYNGTSGTSKFKKWNRWMFYVYYPVHMGVLVIGYMT